MICLKREKFQLLFVHACNLRDRWWVFPSLSWLQFHFFSSVAFMRFAFSLPVIDYWNFSYKWGVCCAWLVSSCRRVSAAAAHQINENSLFFHKKNDSIRTPKYSSPCPVHIRMLPIQNPWMSHHFKILKYMIVERIERMCSPFYT